MTTSPYTHTRFDTFDAHTIQARHLTVSHIIPDDTTRPPATTLYVHNVTRITHDGLTVTFNCGPDAGNVYLHLFPAPNVWPAPDPTNLEYTTHAYPGEPR